MKFPSLPPFFREKKEKKQKCFALWPCRLTESQPVVHDVTSNIPVPEVMKLIWWSVSDVGIKKAGFYWSWSDGLCHARSHRVGMLASGSFFTFPWKCLWWCLVKKLKSSDEEQQTLDELHYNSKPCSLCSSDGLLWTWFIFSRKKVGHPIKKQWSWSWTPDTCWVVEQLFLCFGARKTRPFGSCTIPAFQLKPNSQISWDWSLTWTVCIAAAKKKVTLNSWRHRSVACWEK